MNEEHTWQPVHKHTIKRTASTDRTEDGQTNSTRDAENKIAENLVLAAKIMVLLGAKKGLMVTLWDSNNCCSK